MYTLHVRLIDANEKLLGWASVPAEAHGDGQLWTKEPVLAAIEQDGSLAAISVHWVDLNVELRIHVPTPTPMTLGQILAVFEAGPIFRVGPAAGGLPPIVLRTPVSVAVPNGSAQLTGIQL